MRATRKGVLTVSQAIRGATAQAPAAVRRKGFKAEMDGLRERMRALGFGYDEAAALVSAPGPVRSGRRAGQRGQLSGGGGHAGDVAPALGRGGAGGPWLSG
jgi:hypothetical protein